MLKYGSKDIAQVWHGFQAISAIYKGTEIVWEAIRSCFGSGVWINTKGWINTESWKN